MPYSSTANDLTTLAALKAWLRIGNGEVLAVNVSAGGSGYASAPAVALTGGGGSGATAMAVLLGGIVSYVVVTAAGSGYTSAPSVGFSGGGGSGAAAAAAVAKIDNVGDVALSRLITAASNFILSRLSRKFLVSQAVTEKYDGTGGTRLFVKQFPVTAVAAVTVDGDAIPAASITFGDQWIDLLDGYAFVRGVEVTYTAGYTPAASYELLTLEQACLELCAQKWTRRGHVDQTSVSDGTKTLVFSQSDMPAEVKTLLRRFESVVPA